MLTKTLTLPLKLQAYRITKQKPAVLDIKRLDYNLDALRGFAALFVVIHHLIGYSDHLDPFFFPELLRSFQPHGVLRVLIFFVLSGYVIGLTNKERLHSEKISHYLKKRMVRLYPMFAISLILALTVATSQYSFYTIVGNLTFTQFIFTDLIKENSPIWSLQYEVFYLLLFIPISFFNLNPILIGLLSITIGLLNNFLFFYINIPIFSSYFFGLAFWTSGLIIAKYFINQKTVTNYTILISVLPLVLSLHKLNIFTTVLKELQVYIESYYPYNPEQVNWFAYPISVTDLSYLPYCFMFILLFTGKEFKYKKRLFNILLFLPLLSLLYISKDMNSYGFYKYLVLLAIYGTTLILYYMDWKWLNTVSQKLINAAIWLGGISYAIFLIHFPVLVLFKRITFFSGSPVTFTVRLFLFLGVILLLSYLLEKKFQPLVKRLF